MSKNEVNKCIGKGLSWIYSLIRWSVQEGVRDIFVL